MKDHPWFHDFLAVPIPAELTREEFVARFFPRYKEAYRAPTGIRLAPGGRRVIMSTAGSYQAQVTKRANRIDEAFAHYKRDRTEAVAFDARYTAEK